MSIVTKSIPNSYVHSIYNIRYDRLRNNGIKYAVFDVDCTILPFDDINVTEENKILFNYLKNIGIKAALCSSGFESRVKPVAEALNINYMSGALKPFVDFTSINNMFDNRAERSSTVYIGDSLYLDMYLAGRLQIYKILVDMVIADFNYKIYPNEMMNSVMFQQMERYGVKEKQYYRGYIER